MMWKMRARRVQILAHGTAVVFLAAGFLVFSPAGCSDGGSSGSVPVVEAASTAPASAHPDDPPPMHFDATTMTIKGKVFTVELALTDAQTETGLMYRDKMADDHGMLFVFDHPQGLEFYMKNTRIPLDIVFLDAGGKVVDIEPRRPLDERAYGPAQPTQFVIELNAGTADKIGLARGDVVKIPDKYLKASPASTDK